jgi:hypothetical protein
MPSFYSLLMETKTQEKRTMRITSEKLQQPGEDKDEAE